MKKENQAARMRKTKKRNSEISGSVMIRPVLRAGKTSDIVAVEELEELPLQLYPNPARDEVYINYDCPEYDVRIMDMSGRVVLSASSLSFNARIDVSDLSQGTYLMECRDEQHPSSVKPFIKE